MEIEVDSEWYYEPVSVDQLLYEYTKIQDEPRKKRRSKHSKGKRGNGK